MKPIALLLIAFGICTLRAEQPPLTLSTGTNAIMSWQLLPMTIQNWLTIIPKPDKLGNGNSESYSPANLKIESTKEPFVTKDKDGKWVIKFSHE